VPGHPVQSPASSVVVMRGGDVTVEEGRYHSSSEALCRLEIVQCEFRFQFLKNKGWGKGKGATEEWT